VKRAVLRPQLLGGIASHPESLFVKHATPPWDRLRLALSWPSRRQIECHNAIERPTTTKPKRLFFNNLQTRLLAPEDGRVQTFCSKG